ncbi:hypothetical protein [Streptomyces sp. NPDC005283]|uniref:hypothetical protein n=1 Tax=Streptomyces sp. NPDC005283 TaxID=3156871 RepID=UPI003454C1EF
MTKRLALAVPALLACALLTGCSTVEKKTAEVGGTAKMQEETEKTSSRIFEMIGAKGKATRNRASLMECPGYEPEGKVHQARHPWSVYDLPFEELEKAYAGMRTALPKNGWKITSDGPDKSKAKTPTIVANSPDGEFSVKLRLMDNRKDEDPTSVLVVTVVSRCFEDAPS